MCEQLPNLWALLPFVLLTLAVLRWPRWWEGGNKTWNGETRRGGGRPGLDANPRLKE